MITRIYLTNPSQKFFLAQMKKLFPNFSPLLGVERKKVLWIIPPRGIKTFDPEFVQAFLSRTGFVTSLTSETSGVIYPNEYRCIQVSAQGASRYDPLAYWPNSEVIQEAREVAVMRW